MVDATPSAIMIFSASGALLGCNPEAAGWTGLRMDQAEGFQGVCGQLFPEAQDQRRVREAFESAAAGPEGPLAVRASLRLAAGRLATGCCTLTRICGAGAGREPQVLIRLREEPGPGAPEPSDPRLADAAAACGDLIEAVSALQEKVVAWALRMPKGREPSPRSWDDLLEDSFALAQIRALAEAVLQAVEAGGRTSGGACMVDPDRPVTGVSLGAPVTLPLGTSLQKLERFWILSTLHALGGNRSHCAAHLDIALRTVRNKLDAYRSEGFGIPASTPGRRGRPAPLPGSWG